ncbi:MAG: beta-N-acetylhexosaminidase [Bacteroidales bacterium]|nr:beta-N-acetylhexosaminidase [Bacteroidales bacterium]
MKHILTAAAAVMFLAACTNSATDITVSIVPQPESIEVKGGLKPCNTFVTSIDESLQPEAYTLVIKKGKATIKGGSDAGIFYGEQTLAQIRSQFGGQAPDIRISDAPEFAYRGMHLDCCRHFFSVDEVKEYIDIMALHKFNTFHWHLTEDQGWRAEIKKYPRLTEVGSVRKETLVGHLGSSNKFDGTPYGGYYTQDEMREVVAYAAERHITVIPEIEMPGHALGVLAAYPELGCTGGPYEVEGRWGVFPDILCAGNPKTLEFLKDVLDEICDIFPSEIIHIGGDEAPRDRWKACPKCQAKMKELGFTEEAQLQSYINSEIEKYLATKGRRILGWDEILEGGVTKTAMVMSWRGPEGGKAAAKMGNEVVMTPNSYFYFDYFQTGDPEANGEGIGIGGYLNLERVYSFNPYEDLDEESKPYIKGIQANLWTEYLESFDRVQERVMPRMAATAEIAWGQSRRTSYPEFVERVRKALLPIYEENGYKYADYAFRDPAVD